eukprot:766060-Hanusia_phi.AAC.1
MPREHPCIQHNHLSRQSSGSTWDDPRVHSGSFNVVCGPAPTQFHGPVQLRVFDYAFYHTVVPAVDAVVPEAWSRLVVTPQPPHRDRSHTAFPE